MKKIIITGGTGAIGKKLKEVLTSKGYDVLVLSRKKSLTDKSICYWDIINKKIDVKILKDTYALIHLAGANIAEERWTNTRKQELTSSRVDALDFLLEKFKEINSFPKVLISSSAVGYYGAVTNEKIYVEDDSAGDDFIGQLCKKWEQAAFRFKEFNTRVVVLRTGVVFSNEANGMLQKILPIFKLGLGSSVSIGNQAFPWIHLDDIVNCFDYSLVNENLEGVFNAVAPEHLTNKEFSKNLALVLNKPFFAPAVPKFVMKIVFGELECILTEGSKISAKKIVDMGFEFKFNNSIAALKNLL